MNSIVKVVTSHVNKPYTVLLHCKNSVNLQILLLCQALGHFSRSINLVLNINQGVSSKHTVTPYKSNEIFGLLQNYSAGNTVVILHEGSKHGFVSDAKFCTSDDFNKQKNYEN